MFWNPTPVMRKQRLKRYTVPLDQQEEFESERLWQHVSAAIIRDDMNAATEEKTILEEAQRGMYIFFDLRLLHKQLINYSTFERTKSKM